MFGQKKTSLLGIDITSSAIKVLELGKRGDRYAVEAYGVQPLPAEAVVEGRIADAGEVSRVVKRAVKQSGSKVKDVAVAVSGASVITKKISLPKGLSNRELEEQVTIEAEQYIPYPLEEVMLDFEVVGPSKDDPDAVEIVIAASRRENVDTRIELLEDAGLKVKVVDVEAYTMENVFPLIAQHLPNHGQGMTVALVDIGATITTVNVLHDGKVVYTREQSFGGRLLTEDIERYYGLSYQEAGQAKRENNLPEDYAQKVLSPFKRTMTEHITRSLQFFFSVSRQHDTVDHIVLAGGCASIPGVATMLEQETGTPAIVANPFVDMLLGPKVKAQALSSDAPAMVTACGLAMRSFD
jgi:type IV pilus assembly protein PilM